MSEDVPVTQAALRAEARRMVTAAGHRRLVAPRCRVGHPGGTAVTLPEDVDACAAGLLTDLVERAVDGLGDGGGAGPLLAWVTRSGDLVAGDTDLAWLRAALAAFGRHGLVLPGFLVIGRHGYVDLLGGSGRRWSRVRASRPSMAPGLGDGPARVRR